MRKLLIADASTTFCAALAELLNGAYELRLCHDGRHAMTLLEEFQPDVLVTDLALPGLDGITLLRSAEACPNRPARLVTTRLCSPYIEKMLAGLHVDYIMMKPCDLRSLVERIYELGEDDSEWIPVPNTQTALSNILLTLGIPAGRKGFRYLEAAVEQYRADKSRSLTKEIYPAVGREFHTTAVSVERDVRGAIHAAWENRDEAVWRLYFTPSRSGMVPRPTNLSFIATVAEVLGRQELQQA